MNSDRDKRLKDCANRCLSDSDYMEKNARALAIEYRTSVDAIAGAAIALRFMAANLISDEVGEILLNKEAARADPS